MSHFNNRGSIRWLFQYSGIRDALSKFRVVKWPPLVMAPYRLFPLMESIINDHLRTNLAIVNTRCFQTTILVGFLRHCLSGLRPSSSVSTGFVVAFFTMLTGQTMRFILSPTNLSWPGPQGGQTERFIHSPTELSWPGSQRVQTVRYIRSPTELSWLGPWRGQTVRFLHPPLSYHEVFYVIGHSTWTTRRVMSLPVFELKFCEKKMNAGFRGIFSQFSVSHP